MSSANVASLLSKRREDVKSEVTFDPNYDLSVHEHNVNRLVINHVPEPLCKVGYKTKASSKSESANLSRTNIAMFTSKRRESVKTKLTFDHDHAHFLHEHDNKFVGNHVSKPLHE